MSGDFPTFGDFKNKKDQKRVEVKSKLWDNVKSSNGDFVTFDQYYSKKHNLKLSEVKSRLWDGIESSNEDFITFNDFLKNRILEEKPTGIPNHILEALSNMKNISNYVNIQDPKFLEESKIQYYEKLKEEEDRRKKSLFHLRSNPITESIVKDVCRIGTAIIGRCKIG